MTCKAAKREEVAWGESYVQPRTKEFVHLSTEITSLFYKIITKTTWAYKSASKVLSYATKLISVAQAV